VTALNLADMLSYADIKDLSRIAKNYDSACDTHSKNELIQSILNSMQRKEEFRRQISGLSKEEIRFWNSLLFDTRDAYSLEELTARAMQTKFAKEEKLEWNPRELISAFKHRGWLFNGHSHNTKYLFHVPDDLKRRFSEMLAQHFKTSLCILDGHPEIYREEPMLLGEDVTRFLRFVQKQEVPLSADGYMYKRHLQQILESLSVAEQPVGKTAWRFGYGRRYREYPDRFSLIYDFCFYQGLIDESGGVLLLTGKGHDKADAGAKADIRDLYRFWLKLYKGPVQNLQSLVHWIDLLCTEWVTVDSLLETISMLIKPYYYDKPESILHGRVLQMMLHLGLLRLGEHSEFGKVVRVNTAGSAVIRGTFVPEEDRIDLKIDNPPFALL
jgi:hypothetical protein